MEETKGACGMEVSPSEEAGSASKKRPLEVEEDTKLNADSKRAKLSAGAEKDDQTKLAAEEHLATTTEEEVGITAFLSDNRPGWTAIFKQRWTDFIVNEVALDGTVVHLTDAETIPAEAAVEENKEAENPVEDEKVNEEAAELAKKQAFAAILGEEITEKLFAWITEALAIEDKAERKKAEFDIDKLLDKLGRTQVHTLFREKFPKKFVTETAQYGNIKVRLSGNVPGQPEQNRRYTRWPANRPEYCRFVLYKENKDTTFALNIIGRLLRMKSPKITYAGTKDKRAITAQHMTIHKVDAARLRALNKNLFGMQVGDFKYVRTPLYLGDLKGNRFEIVLRDVKASDELIKSSLEELQRLGFINYYGLQRFGTTSINTHSVGLALLKSEWKEAAIMILRPRSGEDPDSQKARQYWIDTGDTAGALNRMPKHLLIERLLLEGLKSLGETQYLNAFSRLPRNLRTIYGHSYQSYIWNTMASERIKQYGPTRPVVGDLVYAKQDTQAEAEKDEEKEEEEEEAPANGEEEEAVREEKGKVVVLSTEEEVAQYTIDDVVLPVPGYAVIYPTNRIGECYHQLMAKDGITTETFRHKTRDFRLPGGYRRLIERPMDLEWGIFAYDDPKADLSVTDKDRLEGRHSLPTVLTAGKYKAVSAKFTLRSSTYATMCLREMLRQPTTVAFQCELAKQSLAD